MLCSKFKGSGRRIFDIIMSILGLILTIPIWIVIPVLIKLDSKGPVIYKQERVGKNNHIFQLLKFRSMFINAEKHTGPKWAEENDPRITRIGRFIRKFRIDEIPQMVNILKGDMSLVGPRPERPHFVRILSEKDPSYNERHLIKPGLTGLAAVMCRYGASIEDAFLKLRYDKYYIQNISVFLDLQIILRTFFVIANGRKYAR